MGPRGAGTGAGGRILGMGGAVCGSSLGSGVGRGRIGGGSGEGAICADTRSGAIQMASRTSVATTSPLQIFVKRETLIVKRITRITVPPTYYISRFTIYLSRVSKSL